MIAIGKVATTALGRRPLLSLISVALIVGGCSHSQSALDPGGPAAEQTAQLWWLMLGLSAIVFVVVLALLGYAIVRASRHAGPGNRPPISDTLFLGVAGVAVPLVILLILMVDTVVVGRSIIVAPTPPQQTVEVIGHMFWWEIRYPDHQVVTANEIHIPYGVPVRVTLTSVDVIHSFWVPQLRGKLDLNPGKTNVTWIQADSPGVYRGQCAEFCGIQHALMGLLVVADPPDQFATWIAHEGQPAAVPTSPALQHGHQVFVTEGCAFCHTIQGVTAAGSTGAVGPDLTHLASRRTLAAATVENTRENLRLWIRQPSAIKPGAKMPPSDLDPQDLDELVDYLESLK